MREQNMGIEGVGYKKQYLNCKNKKELNVKFSRNTYFQKLFYTVGGICQFALENW